MQDDDDVNAVEKKKSFFVLHEEVLFRKTRR